MKKIRYGWVLSLLGLMLFTACQHTVLSEKPASSPQGEKFDFSPVLFPNGPTKEGYRPNSSPRDPAYL